MTKMYRVLIDKRVFKYINKLGSQDKNYFKRRFKQLRNDYKGYRLLDITKKTELWELRCSSHRVYYTVENDFIVIDNILYEGDIFVSDCSNKNQQQRKINNLKKKIKLNRK